MKGMVIRFDLYIHSKEGPMVPFKIGIKLFEIAEQTIRANQHLQQQRRQYGYCQLNYS
jgi:hypothetical protein